MTAPALLPLLDLNPGLGGEIAVLAVVAVIVIGIVVAAIRRRRWRRSLDLTHPSSEAWRGPNAKPYEQISYRRRDESGGGA